MDFTKKRKAEENGNTTTSTPPLTTATTTTALSPQDIRKLIEPFTKEQLIEIVQTAATQHADILDSIRTVADSDVSLRKLFIRGLSSETTTETIRNLFNDYGELEEAIVIFDKNTGKSKGFGFITFKHVDGALIALKEPSKKIDGRMTVTQLASAGLSNANNSSSGISNSGSGISDVSSRKIYVGNVPYDIPSERLLSFFSNFGEVEEGPLGFDKTTGKSKGFAFFIYKNEDGAKAAIAESAKTIDGHQVICKMAVDNNKKVKTHHGGAGGGDNVQAQQSQSMSQPPPPQGSMTGNQYGVVPGNMQHYGGYSGNGYGMNASAPVSGGGGGGYGGGQYGYGLGLNSDFGGMHNTGGNSMYRMNPSSASGGYQDGGAYGLSQPHQPSSLPPRVPPGGMYQGMPPYY